MTIAKLVLVCVLRLSLDKLFIPICRVYRLIALAGIAWIARKPQPERIGLGLGLGCAVWICSASNRHGAELLCGSGSDCAVCRRRCGLLDGLNDGRLGWLRFLRLSDCLDVCDTKQLRLLHEALS